MKFNEKNIFLLDGVGAAASAVFTGLLLPRFSLFLGINSSLLKMLALIPTTYAIYSLSCYFLIKKTKPWMLLTIICGNLLYCLISLSLILFRERITWRAQVLLAIEIAVILCVVFLEYRIYKKTHTV